MKLLVTGGAGFIGSNFVRWALGRHADLRVTVLDKLTYAGNLDNLRDIAADPRLEFIRGDVADPAVVDPLVAATDAVVNFAAETHVDRSIMDAGAFIDTDVRGTWVLLEAARRHRIGRFLQVSTDEVYGHVATGASVETDPLAPRSPYSASKAGGDLMIGAYRATYGLPVLITRGSNTIGPFQYPEKVVPVFVTNALDDQPLPVYGDGGALRDYIYVTDHCSGIDAVLRDGQDGEIYNVGGGNQIDTLVLARVILDRLGKPHSLIQLVPDRPGHDRRYNLDCGKLRALGWAPEHTFESALAATVDWYVENEWWWRKLKSGEYLDYYRRNYRERGSPLQRLPVER
ncbi:MAG: dTDP-glucose 4,6-dehydratase [Chloroflexi bacterium]|nr:dTDP-glucose 4,6-dehydratase [Chloroflexota bacterium]